MQISVKSRLSRYLDTEPKRAYAFSLTAHISVLIAVLILPLLTAKRYYAGQIRPVTLTSGIGKPGPAGGAKSAGSPKAEKKTGAAKKTNKMKSAAKTAPEKTAPKVTYAKKTAAKQKTKTKEKSLKERLEEKLASLDKQLDKKREKAAEEADEGAGENIGHSLKLSSGTGTMSVGLGDGSGGGGGGEYCPFAWYLDLIQTKITDNWAEPSGLIIPDNNLSVVVFFRLDRAGKILDLYIRTPSNRKDADDSVIDAVKKSEPFPPLPEEYKGEVLDINIKFDLNK